MNSMTIRKKTLFIIFVTTLFLVLLLYGISTSNTILVFRMSIINFKEQLLVLRVCGLQELTVQILQEIRVGLFLLQVARQLQINLWVGHNLLLELFT